MAEETLYQDSQIRIVTSKDNSREQHLQLLRSNGILAREYKIPKGSLRDIATTPRDKLPDKLYNILDRLIGVDALSLGLNIDSVGLAIAQAYIKYEEHLQDEEVAGRILSEHGAH
jgi:hypothetical protein